ncbi:unnamed protein product [Pieris macdunnoughi]|uniref:Serpin domain-containing protein n=1 Tax=Pieris macdunnoughi TaxID=345717 RepID=A0A821N1L7_9NEOP|nr:unnamed protein product [Pieris macdunnoughi]
MLIIRNIVILVCVTSVICSDIATSYSDSQSSAISSSTSFSSAHGPKCNHGGHPKCCGPNEVVDDCVNGGCRRRNCSDLAEPIKCIDPIHCIRGCRCRDGYLRDKDGGCVPLTSCPIPNCNEGEIFDFCPGYCQPECGVDQTLILCKPSPQPGDPDCNPACRCADHLYRTAEGACVPKEHCPLVCPYDEVYEECPDPCVPNICASIWSRFKPCPPCPEDCKPTCRCPEGQFRNEIGQCITYQECSECPLNERYVNNINEICRAKTCSELDQHLPCQVKGYCNTGPPGCICIDGYVRNADGVCVLTTECPPKCPKGEVYEKCPDPCVPNTCEVIYSTYKPCPPCPEDCKPTCRCPDGQFRNKIGQCITSEECLKCTGPHEYFSCGGACDNECDKLSQQSKDNCPIVNIQCNRMCYCEDGYARDANNTCIPIHECPPECPLNERYVNNINEICRAKTCSELDQHLPCQEKGYCNTGPPGCICIDGYVRNADGVCVLTTECPPKCPKGEVYEKCPDPCIPNTCASIWSKYKPCPPCPEDCKPTCRCPDGQHRNKIGQCITTEECSECPVNEHYVKNINEICRAKTCSELGNPLPCLEDGYDNSGPPGCICDDGFIRNCDGLCVPTTECPACGGDFNATTGPGTFCITCDNYKKKKQVACILIYKINGCACRDKYVYNKHLKQCVLPEDCHESDEQQRMRNNFDQGNDDFTSRFLYDVIDEKPNASVITSPFSVLFLLSQLALYAKGKTYEQLASLLNLNKRNDIRSTIPQYLDEINSQRNVNFSLAERVFGSIDYPFSKSFKRDTKLTFHAQARNLDFSEPKEAAKEINSWIASQTNDLIKDLISPSALDENTRLVLTNAIYFKGDWKSPFNSKKTRPETFHVTNRKKTSVKMMNQIGHFNYGYIENIQSKVVQMFYKNENFSFLSILPNKRHSVHSVADQLQDLDLQYDVINNLDSARVNLSIPVIHTESSTDLADILKKNGVTALFNSSSSDLSGILMYPEALYVSSAIQKAKIIVNEAGSEAAAANAITVGTTAVEAEPEQFNANHPFLYYIMYRDTAIFAGHYAGAQ